MGDLKPIKSPLNIIPSETDPNHDTRGIQPDHDRHSNCNSGDINPTFAVHLICRMPRIHCAVLDQLDDDVEGFQYGRVSFHVLHVLGRGMILFTYSTMIVLKLVIYYWIYHSI